MTKLAKTMNVLTHVHSLSAAAELSVSQISTRAFVFALQECRVTLMWPALRSVVSQMRTAPLMRNVTINLETALPFASTMTVLKEPDVRHKIIRKSALVIIHCKETVTPVAQNVSF